MDNEEKAFQKKQQTIEEFKLELKTLFSKYNFGIKETDNYDNEENYQSTEFYFIVDGDPYYIDTIQDIINDCINK